MSATTSRIPSGWVFAAVVIVITGSLNLIWGISALSNKEFFRESALLFEALQTWGIVYLIIGSFQLVVAGLIYTGHGLGAGLGMLGAFFAILVNFLSIGAYPVWSCILIAINFLVIFQLATNWE
ncbi:MAG: hypothetical protein JHC84_06225 [Solirubrobacteraceae bacterium]|nr:hypothetical protein [Solirubrobacteraceae bacterium]